jgi:hypothetical protein
MLWRYEGLHDSHASPGRDFQTYSLTKEGHFWEVDHGDVPNKNVGCLATEIEHCVHWDLIASDTERGQIKDGAGDDVQHPEAWVMWGVASPKEYREFLDISEHEIVVPQNQAACLGAQFAIDKLQLVGFEESRLRVMWMLRRSDLVRKIATVMGEKEHLADAALLVILIPYSVVLRECVGVDSVSYLAR